MRINRLKIIDSGLFLYGVIVTFFLTISAFFNLNSTQSVIAILLFLPVSLYFAIRIFSLIKRLFQTDNFSLANFIRQSETTFLVNLVLLCFATALILIRISIQIILK